VSRAAAPALPASIAPVQLAALRSNPSRWLAHAEAIASAHGIGGDVRAFADGSNLVAALGEGHVLKLFAPFLAHQHESERAALRHLDGKVGVATPALVGEGEHQGWPWLIMTRVEGEPLHAVWPALDDDARRALLHDLGALVAAVQRVPVGPLCALEPRWPAFLVAQAAGALARHQRLGMPAHLLAALEGWLQRTQGAVPVHAPPTILTGEYTPGNVLLARRSGRWAIAGLIDFGDVMIGFAEYDLLGPATFSCAGDAGLLRALLQGWGMDRGAMGDFRMRAMRMLLLHRYAHLDAQVRIDGWRERARSLDELAELLWPSAALR
jgi:hygromycin-B 7''-O-kinase